MAEQEYLGREWLTRIRAEEKRRDDKWGKDAEAATKAYTLDPDIQHGKLYDFNIFHSNVETLLPAVFNSSPVPDIRERFPQGDGVAREAADILERVISVQIDDGALVTEVECVVKDGETAGRGIVRVRFDTGPRGERVYYECVPWRDYIEGPAKRFDQVPWMAFRHRLDRGELERISDKELISRQPSEPEAVRSDDNDVIVWELWKGGDKKVCFIREENGELLKEMPDPLGLSGFFPVPRPYQPLEVAGRRDPVVPFAVYRKLCEELDLITRRIDRITSGLKVRGIIVTGANDLERLAQAEDNELIPVAAPENLVAMGGLDKIIQWWPVDKAIQVLATLYETREQTKQAIYEVTGLSDILRGASEEQETATAQQIKTQWGSLRIRRRQALVERMVRDLFCMTCEMIGSRFSPRTIAMQAGMPVSPGAEQLIRDPLGYYRIDVESDSTVRADLTRSRGEMGAFLEGTANYFNVMGQVVQQAPQIAGPIVSLYSAFARQFNLGRQAESALDQLIETAKQAASQPPPNPEAQAKQAELQLKAQEAQGRQQLDAAKLQIERDKAILDGRLKEAELGLKAQDQRLKELEIRLKERELGLRENDAAFEQDKAVAEFARDGEQADRDEAFRARQQDSADERSREEMTIKRRQAERPNAT